ncbi:MAG: carboxypeptidase-like regulatory domain-containing protein [Kofleriaceae bacterium]
MISTRALTVAVIVLWAANAVADPLSQLSGRVSDRNYDTAVEGALVYVSGEHGLAKTITTDAAGRYRVALEPGTYFLIFAYGNSRTSSKITITADQPATLDGKLDSLEGEVIVIKEKIKPPVMPKPKDYKPNKAPPYSDRAILSDAWTKAHLLLDVTEAGDVVRFKWLKRPGYDLEKIAIREVFKQKFEPARDAMGRPMRAWVVWSIEWPSAWWLDKFVGTRTGMPPVTGFPPRRKDHYVPCRGSGPMNLGSLHPTYKDCSRPDLSKINSEVWQTASAGR